METRANYVLIGLFTVAVIAAGFGFVYWFHRGGGIGERAVYRVLFDGPVSGLRTGAPVLFNGIRVGEIADLALNSNDPRKVIATITVAKSAPVRADTRVGVEYQGLTGIASLSLRGGAQAAAPLTPANGQPPVLQADPGSTQDLMQAGREVLRKVDEMLIENQTALRNAVKNLETFTAVMARNADRVDRIVGGVETAVQGAENMISGRDGRPGEIQQAVQSFRQLGDNLDRRSGEAIQSFKQLTDNLDQRAGETLESVKKLAENLDRRADNLDQRASDAIESVKRLADNLDGRAGNLDKRASDAIDSVKRLADNLDGRTGNLDKRASDAIDSVRQLAGNLDQRSGEAVQSFKQLADNLDQRSGETIQSVKRAAENLDQRVTETMQSVKQLADNLDKRTADISVGLTRFSTQGLAQWERFAVDGRRAANEFERAVRNFERNPSRLIWGGSLRENSGAPAATGAPAQRRRRQ